MNIEELYNNIEERIKNRESVYNLSADKRENQFSKGVKLEIMDFKNLPKYIYDNKEKYKDIFKIYF